MNISQALKQKNRIIRELNLVTSRIQNNLRHDKDKPAKIDFTVEMNIFDELKDSLIDLKSRIAKANAGIAKELVELAETKATLSTVSMWPAGEDSRTMFTRGHLDGNEIGIISELSELAKIEMINHLNKHVDELQDEIDRYNATTEV